MKRKSTQKISLDKEEKVVVPSQKTMALLKQFARSYYVDKTLPDMFNGFCIN